MDARREQKILCSVDWLGLSLRLAGEVKPIPGFVWREYSVTNVWNKRRILYTDEGDKVLTLLSEPRSSIISASAGLVEIENEWLYHGGGYKKILETLYKSVFYEVLGISRLDLCVDFQPTKEQSDIIENLANDSLYVVGKQNGSGFWSTNTNQKINEYWLRRRIKHQQSWGHKTSAIKWKLYFKTKELLDAVGGGFYAKPYIVDMWREHGLDISNVWRLEVSMKHLNDYTIYGHPINLEWLEDNQIELFCQMYNSRFQIAKNQGHKDRTNDQRVEFLPLPNIFKTFERNEPKSHRQRNGRITLLRHLVASLDDEQVLLDKTSREAVYEHIDSIIQRDNLGNYFMAVTGKWFDNWVADKEDEADGSMRLDIARPAYNGDIAPNPHADDYDPTTEQNYWKNVSRKVSRDLGLDE